MAARVLFVTGKGGTGKSTIAAALATEAAARGRRVLLLRMPSSSPPTVGAPPRHTSAAATRGSHRSPPAGALLERTLDEKKELEGFLTRVLGLGMLARRLGDSRTFASVAAAAPGLRDLVLLTAIATAAKSRRDLVLLDAPSTGHSLPLLTSASRVLDLAPVGPVAGEARRARRMLGDPRAFRAVLTTTPEELPISEVCGLRRDVLAAGVAAVHVVVNGLWPAYLPAAKAARVVAQSGSADAALHWDRHRRQRDLCAAIEGRVGDCAHVGFSFDGAEPPQADVVALLERVTGDPV